MGKEGVFGLFFFPEESYLSASKNEQRFLKKRNPSDVYLKSPTRLL